MPRGDRTGPMGLGPMTGRGAGGCAGFRGQGAGFGFGRAFRGMGRGAGRGWCFPWFSAAAQFAPQSLDETDALKQEAEYLEHSLSEIRERLAKVRSNSGTT